MFAFLGRRPRQVPQQLEDLVRGHLASAERRKSLSTFLKNSVGGRPFFNHLLSLSLGEALEIRPAIEHSAVERSALVDRTSAVPEIDTIAIRLVLQDRMSLAVRKFDEAEVIR